MRINDQKQREESKAYDAAELEEKIQHDTSLLKFEKSMTRKHMEDEGYILMLI